jgi:hypothetical protein
MNFCPVGIEFFGQWRQWWSNVKSIESKKTMFGFEMFLIIIFELECHFKEKPQKNKI